MGNFWDDIRGTFESAFGIGNKGGPELQRVGSTARLRLPNLLRWQPGGAVVPGTLYAHPTTGDLAVKDGATPFKNNITTSNPTINDDDTQGYEVGSVWINTSTNQIFVLVDASTGAAIWQEYGNGIPIPLSSVQGDVLIRNATQWTRLPAGFPGQTLESQGAAADASWGARDSFAAIDPTVNNDNTQGYGVGSHWVNTSTKRVWYCVNSATGAAEWIRIDSGDIKIWQKGQSIFDSTAPYKSSTNTSPIIAAKIQFPGTTKLGVPTSVHCITQAGNSNVNGSVLLIDVTNPALPVTIASVTISFAARSANIDYIDTVPIIGAWSTGSAVLEVQFFRVSGTSSFRMAEITIEKQV